MVLIIHKINTVKNIYTLSNTRYRYSVLGKNGLKYSVLGTRQNLVLGSALVEIVVTLVLEVVVETASALVIIGSVPK